MRPCVFLGNEGMGKTALLRQCAAMVVEEGGIVIAVESSGSTALASALADGIRDAKHQVSMMSRIRDAAGTLRKLMPSASYELPGDVGKIELDLRSDDETVSVRRSLDELNDVVRRRGSFLALSIDELQDTRKVDASDLLSIVHVLAGTSKPITFFAAGLAYTQHWLKTIKSYTERFNYMQLTFLTQDAAKAAISVPAISQGITFTDDALDLLASESMGYPFYIQEYASRIWTDTTGPVIRGSDVTARIPHIRLQLDRQLFSYLLATLTAEECSFVLALADLNEGPHVMHDLASHFVEPHSLGAIRTSLVKKGVLSQMEGVADFRVPLTAAYVLRNRGKFELRAQRSDLQRLRK